MKRISFTICIFLFYVSLVFGQQRALLHINQNGTQEAMPLQKGEKVLDAIARFEKNVPFGVYNANSLIDTLRNTIPPISTNFGFMHQDVGFQWYVPETDGIVKELWWFMYRRGGATLKAQIRGWNADPKLLTLPANAFDGTGRMGYYVKSNDGDGLVTPFKAEATDPYFFAGNGGDTAKIKFDPLGTENAWKAGGVQVTQDTGTNGVWNKLILSNVVGSVPFTITKGLPFGFTIQNAAPTYVADPLTSAEWRMEILSSFSVGAPYHSIKFYEIPTSAANKPGWQIRSYEWGMYVVIEYTNDRGPKIKYVDQLFNTVQTTSRQVKANITDDNPGGGAAGVASATINWKKGSLGTYTAIAMTGTEPNYTGSIPGAFPGDTMFYYVEAKDVNNNISTGRVYSYTIFLPRNKKLLMYNYRTDIPGFGPADLASVYYDPITSYDIWNVKLYGVADLPALLPNYDVIVEVSGDGGNGNMPTIGSAAVATWLASGTPVNPKLYFFSDQDHGWISNYADTTFDDANVHAKYFGVKTLGPQDYPNGSPKTWNINVDPVAATSDSVVSFIKKFQTATGTSLWYNIKYELSSSFSNWMDEIKPTSDARVIFRDLTGGLNRVVGVRKQAVDRSWSTVYLAFDQLALDFQSDTSKAPASDPKYAWLPGVGNMVAKFISNPFFNSTPTSSVSVVSPNGGENWIVGSVQPIQWNSNGVNFVKIEYTTNAGSTWNLITSSTPAKIEPRNFQMSLSKKINIDGIVSSSPLSNTYYWTVPNTPSVQCYVRVTDVNNSSITDVSNSSFTISNSLPPSGNWTIQSFAGITFRTVKAVDSLVIWAAGMDQNSRSVVYKTIDGGNNWTSSNVDSISFLVSLEAINSQRAWIGGGEGKIFTTTDGGVTWQKQYQHPKNTIIRGIKYVAANTLVVTADPPQDSIPGSQFLILRSTNNGQLWNQMSSAPLSDPTAFEYSFMYKIDQVGSNANLRFGTTMGRIYQSKDYGLTWSLLAKPQTQGIYGIGYFDEMNGMLSGSFGTIRKTSNGGASWDSVNSYATNLLRDIVAIPGTTFGWSFGEMGIILKTTDRGNTWSPDGAGITSILFRASFVNENKGWAVTTGAILKYSKNQIPPPTTSWKFAKQFPFDGFPINASANGGHGITVDPDGKIWVQYYYTVPGDSLLDHADGKNYATRAIYVFYPNGLQTPFSPLKVLVGSGINDTLWSAPSIRAITNRGLGIDRNGNILASCFDRLYRLNYKTGAVMNKVLPLPGYALTAPGSDNVGNVYITSVLPDVNPIKIYDQNFNYVGNVTDTSRGFSRTLTASADGQRIYFAGYTNHAVTRYTGNSVSGFFADTVLKGFDVESILRNNNTGYIWASSGSGNDLPNRYPGSTTYYNSHTWYSWDPVSNLIKDSIRWNGLENFTSNDYLNIRPRGIAFNASGDTAYVTCFNTGTTIPMFTPVQMFVRGQVFNPVPVTHTITFRADLNRLVSQGFNTSSDYIVVNGSFNGWSNTIKMTNIGGNIYSYTVSITAKSGDKIQFKFKAFPDNKFTNNGWETDQPTPSYNREFYFVDADQTLPNIDPSISVLQSSIMMGISQTDIDFIGTRIGQTSDIILSIKDSSSSPGNLIGNISLSGFNNWFTIVSGGGAYNLAPGQSQNIVIRYNAAVAGFAKAVLTITNNSFNMANTLTIPVTGYGVQVVQMPKRILVDTKHGFYGSIDSNYFADVLNLLRTAGHTVVSNQAVFNLTGFDYLFSLTQKDSFTVSEVSQIQNFVNNGGRLLLIGDHSGAFGRNIQNKLLSDNGWNTGIKIDSTIVKDSLQSIASIPYWIKVSNFAKTDNLFVGVDTLGVFASASISVASPAQVLMTTSSGGSTQTVQGVPLVNSIAKKNRFENYINDGESILIVTGNSPITDFSSTYKINERTSRMMLPSTAYSLIPLGAKVSIGSGRIIVLGDVNIFSLSFATLPGQSGLGLRYGSNRVFALNLFRGFGDTIINPPSTSPKIIAIKDVPNDNGKQVSVTWKYSPSPAQNGVTKFALWRRDSVRTFVLELPSLNDTIYSAVVPTLFDSTKLYGMKYSIFQVSAHTQNPAIYSISTPDSGYSIDNIFPQIPSNVNVLATGATQNTIKWKGVSDEDLLQYKIYRSTLVTFVLDNSTYIGKTADTVFVDKAVTVGVKYYYRITAMDFSGNESKGSNSVTSVKAFENIPTSFSLEQNYPNPFNPRTRITFGIPVTSSVRLTVYNTLGQLIETLETGTKAPGMYFAEWGGNKASGIYIYQIEAVDVNNHENKFIMTKRMVLLK